MIESLFLQIHSKLVPLTDDVLRNEIGIDKLGYRTRILGKLKEDGRIHLENLHQQKQLEGGGTFDNRGGGSTGREGDENGQQQCIIF